MSYELHQYHDNGVRVILHNNTLYNRTYYPNVTTGKVKEKSNAKYPLEHSFYLEILMHWHKNPELLYVTNGCLLVKTDTQTNVIKSGEIAIIDSDQMHFMTPVTPQCTYTCMIPNINLCGEFSHLPAVSKDPDVISLYNKIVKEFTTRNEGYKRIIENYIACMFSILTRFCDNLAEKGDETSAKLLAVKSAINYINDHFKDDISIDDIAKKANLSRYYLCHIFKEITGQTVLSHLNYVRCNNAYELISSGKYTVSQSASLSGFNNLSYFSKIYRNIMGHLPSKDVKK